ncbi:MAG: hypothetical protein FWC53_02630 [Firmicutes bacterium]|nr:hypothetical protein [Bacillota bacterium]
MGRKGEPNKETLEAMQEAEDIVNGKIKTKSYSSVKEMIEDWEKEDEITRKAHLSYL